MTRVSEDDVHDALTRYEGEGTVQVGESEVTVTFDTEDIHTVDSPDCLLHVTLEFELFGQTMQAKLPLPVEAEAAGLHNAEEDLRKLVERRNHVPEFPMLIVAEKGFDRSEEQVEQAVDYRLRQMPERLLDE